MPPRLYSVGDVDRAASKLSRKYGMDRAAAKKQIIAGIEKSGGRLQNVVEAIAARQGRDVSEQKKIMDKFKGGFTGRSR